MVGQWHHPGDIDTLWRQSREGLSESYSTVQMDALCMSGLPPPAVLAGDVEGHFWPDSRGYDQRTE
eukprot:9103872-Prorocentrum_lima.AAC.1